ncbi:PCI-domain-containing protein [Calocera cornea HHB12733]|uniref:PCI-domain-containing protein n=1 Tax=Calocera cornea HHB12733 TaxID=1353952 RepID=A0A165CJ77_9BASI|nr:PCI-domain-containing protein [Calocera cornea HHB12733]
MDVDHQRVDVYLEDALNNAPPTLRPFFQRFRTLYDQKRWHQLTLAVNEFLADPESGPYQVDLFNRFVRDFEGKINQLRLAEMGVKVCRQVDDPQKTLGLLTSLLVRISVETSPEAHILLLSTLAQVKLLFGDLEGTKADVDKCEQVLDSLDSVEGGVNAAFYKVAADYYKAKAEYGPYYKNSLLYLACINPETDLNAEERLSRAHDLALAALLGDTIYNFGELLMHPILDSLTGSQYEWIRDLLFVFNSGNIGKFEVIATQFSREPILAVNHTFLRQKICLMALIETVFQRKGRQDKERPIGFQTIAEETRLPQDEVEHLVMKALSLKLIRGTLDQVSEQAHISWVQPRVLGREQIEQLAVRLNDWTERLGRVENFVASQDLFAGVTA